MKIKKEYERWLANAVADTDVAAELKAMDYVEVEDAFYRDLAFGTGGLRGVIISSLIVATIMAFGQVIAQVLGGQFYGMEYYCNVNGEADDFIILYPIIIAIGRLLFGNRAIPFGTL